jgi:hypothetical protein
MDIAFYFLDGIMPGTASYVYSIRFSDENIY